MTISDHVSVSASYTRSINIERDGTSASQSIHYVPTSKALQVLATFSERFCGYVGPRSWSIIGPYGSGKSSFALFLSSLLTSPSSKRAYDALQLLKSCDSELASKFRSETENSSGYLEILISGTPESLSIRYLSGLRNAISAYVKQARKRKPVILRKLDVFIESGNVSVNDLMVLTKEAQTALSRYHCPGMIIVFDEFGKFLEYESKIAGANEIFFLQTLAELAQAEHSVKMFVFVLLHQAIEQYAKGVGEKSKTEWAKIQGRFEEIPFMESAEQTLRVVAASIKQKPFGSNTEHIINQSIEQAVRVLAQEELLPPAMDENDAVRLFRKVYPMHPLTALILPNLCQLISQNERSLFSYISSREHSGFKDMLARLHQAGDFIRPDHIFDYFIQNHTSIGGDHLTQRRWAESVSAIDRLSSVTEHEMRVLKAIGVINVLGSRGNIRASDPVISLVYGESVAGVLQSLLGRSAIVFRKFNRAYKVWEGSDFDLETELNDEMHRLGPFSLAEKLTEEKSLTPIVARKYTIETGALRYFDIKFVDASGYIDAKSAKNPQIFIFLSEGQDDLQIFQSHAKVFLANLGLTGYFEGGNALRQIVSERLALSAIEKGNGKLREDPIAKIEFNFRNLATIRAEKEAIDQIITNPERSSWTYDNEDLEIFDRREFQACLSGVLKKIFPAMPVIHNELLNRDRPTSQGVAARNKLLMLLSDYKSRRLPDLGIDGFPPEKAAYRSILKENGLHVRSTETQSWRLVEPHVTSTLRPVWEKMGEFFASTKNEPKSFQQLNIDLISPPFGVKAGVLPVLWYTAYLLNEHELALYEDGRYIPGFDAESLSRFVKRPDVFSVQQFKLEGINATIFTRYADIMTGGRPPQSLLDIARAISDLFGKLPNYTLKTQTYLSERAVKVRSAFQYAKSPEVFLLEALPKALGFTTETKDQSLDRFPEILKDVLYELKNNYPKLIADLRKAFEGMLRLKDTEFDLGRLRDLSQGKCSGLESYSLDIHGTRKLLQLIHRSEANGEIWFENILTFLGDKPSRNWTDEDRRKAEATLRRYSSQINDLFALQQEEYRYKQNPETDADFDVYLLKSFKRGSVNLAETIAVDKDTLNASDSMKQKLNKALQESHVDNEVKLAALAQVVDDFLRSKKAAESTIQTNQGPHVLEEVNQG